MASGYGYKGGRNRCFAYWQDFQKCYAGADSPAECTPQKEDYLECLHHTKEIARQGQVKHEYQTQAAKELETRRKEAESTASGGIMSLGLLAREREESSSSESEKSDSEDDDADSDGGKSESGESAESESEDEGEKKDEKDN